MLFIVFNCKVVGVNKVLLVPTYVFIYIHINKILFTTF